VRRIADPLERRLGALVLLAAIAVVAGIAVHRQTGLALVGTAGQIAKAITQRASVRSSEISVLAGALATTAGLERTVRLMRRSRSSERRRGRRVRSQLVSTASTAALRHRETYNSIRQLNSGVADHG
jgi:hypothetical protein